MFSRLVRSRADWACVRCGKRFRWGDSALHCSHFHSRRLKSVRFDPDNVEAMCARCHHFLDTHPRIHQEWKQRQLGGPAGDQGIDYSNGDSMGDCAMSSDAEIRRAYLDDKKHPYYSVQRGKPFLVERMCQRPQQTGSTKVNHPDAHWTWGHFQTAFQRALAD